jgi:type II secretory pathway component PulF
MNYDEFAFFNQQLAAMLRDGIPLEGALKQLGAGMKDSATRAELAALQDDLARGTPLREAIARRQLPPLYVQMVNVGVRSNDLPGVLTMLADHYQRTNTIWTRLKGLMVYPFIVVAVSLGLTLILSSIFSRFLKETGANVMETPRALIASIWIPPLALSFLLILGVVLVVNSRLRARMRWRFPGFRDANLASLASSIALMLKSGTTLPEALALAEQVESNSPAAAALAQWRHRVMAGDGKPAQWPESIKPFPPMFLWLVRKGGEDIAAGFQKAAEIYRGRANYRIEMALYGVLPVSILLLGQMIIWQVAPVFRWLIIMMNWMGGGFGD